MSKTRAEIEAEYEAACLPIVDAYDAALSSQCEACGRLGEALAYALMPHNARREAALAALDAAEHAAAEKVKP